MLQTELNAEGKQVEFSVVGRRGASTMRFRGEELRGEYIGFTDRPAFADARRIADELIAAYVDEELDRVDLIYNRYVSPLTQYVRRQTLLPVQEAEVFGEGVAELQATEEDVDEELAEAHRKALWVYEPDPEELLAELIPEYAQLSVYRALLESTASEHGSRMTAMRSAADNAKEVISRPHPGDEQGAAGRDHPGNLGSRQRRRGRQLSSMNIALEHITQGDEWLRTARRAATAATSGPSSR